MTIESDPFGFLSLYYAGECDFPEVSPDAVNHYGTPPLSPWDVNNPGDNPLESFTRAVDPIDPAIQGFTSSTDNFESWTDNLVEYQAAEGLAPHAKRAAHDSSHRDEELAPVDNHRAKRLDSRQSTLSSDGSQRVERDNERQLEKNRLAANKCRQKKKKENKHLEDQSRVLEREKVELKATASMLHSEVLLLKNEILKHGLCSDCEPIQSYILETANRIVSGKR